MITILARTAALFMTSITIAAAAPAPEQPPAHADAAEKATLRGFTKAADGSPIRHAKVYIHAAWPRDGLALFCPTCYRDCGKWHESNVDGEFQIEGLDPALLFDVLTLADGRVPLITTKVDPRDGAAAFTLEPRPELPADPKRIVRGKVIGPGGEPIAGALVEPRMFLNTDLRTGSSHLEGADPLAITDREGRWVITTPKAIGALDIGVAAPGYATGIANALAPGEAVHEVKLTSGATVFGKLERQGKPVGGMRIGLALASHSRNSAYAFATYEIATRDDGTFCFNNVIPNRPFVVFGLMKDFGPDECLPIKQVEVGADDTTVDAGTLTPSPAHTVRGRVVLSDGKAIEGTRAVTLSRSDAWDTVTVTLGADGSFELKGVPREVVTLSTRIPGYRFSDKNQSHDRMNIVALTGRVEGDIEGLVLLMDKDTPRQPALPPSRERPLRGVDPSLVPDLVKP